MQTTKTVLAILAAMVLAWLVADRLSAADKPTEPGTPAALAAKEAASPAAPAESSAPVGERVEAEYVTLPVINRIYILVLAGFVGFEVIRRVSPLLHTPLMSATNAISGISLVGSLVAAGNPKLGFVSNLLGFIAVTAATINVVGGFMITDRMLKMFKLRGRDAHGA